MPAHCSLPPTSAGGEEALSGSRAAPSPGITASQLWHLGEVSSLTGSRFAYLSRGGDDGLSLRAVLLQGQDEMEQIQHLAGQMAIILIVIVSFKSNL